MPNRRADRRVLERHEEIAPQHEHAVSVGRGLGLGPVVGLFVRETQGPGQTALGLLLICLIFSLCFVPLGIGETKTAPMWVAWAIAAVLLVLIVVLGRWFFRPGRSWWLYLFEAGLAALDYRGRVQESLCWKELDHADWEWTPYEDGGAGLTGYRLGTYDGRVMKLPTTFENAYDTYAPVGGILRTLTPGIDRVLPRFPTLAESLDAAAVQPLARRALDRLAVGQPLVFGKVRVEPSGITYAKKRPLLWGELTGWTLGSGQLKLERAPGRPKRLVIPMTEIDGGWILIHVLAKRAPRTES
jgi:hypothetical protein